MHITLNEANRELVEDDFNFTERGEEKVKDFGPKKLYYLDSEIRDRN